MRQHSIDLLPEAIRLRNQAGLRAGRMIGALAAAVALLILSIAHSRYTLSSAQQELAIVSVDARDVVATEAKTQELQASMERLRSYAALYDRIALPLQVNEVIATVVGALPESVTLDQLDLETGGRAPGRTARSRTLGASTEAPPRMLTAELSGFAANDQQIVELVNHLSATPPLREVSLDFSRTREVYGQTAREFRLSFRIDLEARYRVTHRADEQPRQVEVANAQ